MLTDLQTSKFGEKYNDYECVIRFLLCQKVKKIILINVCNDLYHISAYQTWVSLDQFPSDLVKSPSPPQEIFGQANPRMVEVMGGNSAICGTIKKSRQMVL